MDFSAYIQIGNKWQIIETTVVLDDDILWINRQTRLNQKN